MQWSSISRHTFHEKQPEVVVDLMSQESALERMDFAG
jgi:hypothetical protein